MIKAIIYKEIRENLKIAVPGLVVFFLGTWYVQHNYNLMMQNMALGISQFDANRAQPLLWPSFLMQVAWCCGIFGAVLGGHQIWSERNRDLSAFLTHRPISRSQIFVGKIMAGLLLYLVTMGLPFIWFILWDATAGHVAAPFEPGMMLPAACLVLAGVAFYFAGMLTAQRQARWYGSRALGFGLALSAMFLAYATMENTQPRPPGWAWPIMVLAVAAILAVAAWGSFHQQGVYLGQPWIARLALIVTVFVGSAVVFGLCISFASSVLWPSRISYSYSSHVMTLDGTIYRREVRQGEFSYMVADVNGNYINTSSSVRYYDLQGNLLMSQTNKAPMGQVELSKSLAATSGLQARFDEEEYRRSSQQFQFFDVVRSPTPKPDGVIWYYSRTTGRVVGYSVGSRRLLTSLGPDGFANTVRGNGSRFLPNYQAVPRAGQISCLFASKTSAFSVDLDQQTISPFFTTTNDEPVGGIAAAGWTNLMVVTPHWVHLLDGNGKELAKTPYQPGYSDFGIVQMSVLHPLGRFAVWFQPTMPYEKQLRLKPHTHVVWLAENGAITNSMDLPDLPQPQSVGPSAADHLWALVSPSWGAFPNFTNTRKVDWILSMLGTAISLGMGWWLDRRYRLGSGTRIGWGIFILLFNALAVVTMVFVREWPARVECPNCRKRRVVDHHHCEHCGAEFAPAPKTGIEIFEPVATK